MISEEEKLITRGITPTPIRILVLRCLVKAPRPMSLTDLEIALESVDKSTISRTLTLFKDHHLIHWFNDGSGSMKYEYCTSEDPVHHSDQHVHFRCERCGETLCLEELPVPEIVLPQGFEIHGLNYMVNGVCKKCNEKFVGEKAK